MIHRDNLPIPDTTGWDRFSRHIAENRGVPGWSPVVARPYEFPDGTRLSIQANDWVNCHPKNITGPWSAFEVFHWTKETDPGVLDMLLVSEVNFNEPRGWVPLSVLEEIHEFTAVLARLSKD